MLGWVLGRLVPERSDYEGDSCSYNPMAKRDYKIRGSYCDDG